MSLMHLLAVGKSILNIEDHPSPYKMTRDKLLPKFGSSKDELACSPEPVAANLTKMLGDTATAEAGLPPELLGETKDIGVAESQAASPLQPVKSHLAYPRGRWTMIKNPFARKSELKTEKTPVQGELSLDSIKVVRNDLSDADLEVIPAHPASAPVQAKPEIAVEHATSGMLLEGISSLVWHRQNLKR